MNNETEIDWKAEYMNACQLLDKAFFHVVNDADHDVALGSEIREFLGSYRGALASLKGEGGGL